MANCTRAMHEKGHKNGGGTSLEEEDVSRSEALETMVGLNMTSIYCV